MKQHDRDPYNGFSRGGMLLYSRVPAWVNLVGLMLLTLVGFVLLAAVLTLSSTPG